MHNAVLLAEENRQLRAENEKQKRKRATKRSFIQSGGVLTVQEGLERSQVGNTGPEERTEEPEQELQIRAPRTCSLCRSLEHTARTCSLRA